MHLRRGNIVTHGMHNTKSTYDDDADDHYDADDDSEYDDDDGAGAGGCSVDRAGDCLNL